MVGALVYSGSQASSIARKKTITPKSAETVAPLATLSGNSAAVTATKGLAAYSLAGSALFAPFQAPAITIEENTCSTAETNFDLNQNVCITVSGSQYIGQRLVVADPQNVIRQSTTITTSPQAISFPVPATPTTPLDGGFVDENNLGTWGAVIVTGRGGRLAGANFVVRNPIQANANVEIYTSRTGGDVVTAGSTVTYEITMVNFGPDAAVNAKFTNPTPSFTTFQAVDGPIDPPSITCTDPGVGNVGDVVCTITSLPAGVRTTFTVQYLVGSVGAGTSIGNTVSVTTDTNNISGETSASSTGSVSGSGTPTGCTLTCPANITVTSDTTGPNPADPSETVSGAVVTFATESGGSCGSVTSSPASGSFFPVGTTVVTSSSSEGGGECSFTVTVTQTGGAVSIACPGDKVANADANCVANVALGTPTTTGDNVTVVGTRSD
ncbi:MAG TPA: hypothetical protein VHQ64_07245, partial [Pyrinomonadaceae bacterium]|nr:hypothetical protein [Pyrinomonadaceae bacterium]